MIEIKFTKEQYRNLVDLVYLGNWMVNAIRETGKQIQKYEDVEQHIYYFAKEGGLENLIEFDDKLSEFFPSREFEEETDVEKFRVEYNDEIFWDELIDRSARHDFTMEYGEDDIREMTWKERMEKEYPFLEKYEEEFVKYGIKNLEITELD
jgi:hypothetical protein